MAPVSQNLISFHSEALADEHMLVTRLEGVDRISRMYRHELELVSKIATFDLEAMVGTSCTIGIKQGVQLRGSTSRGRRTVEINGLITQIELAEKRHDQVVWHIVVEPRLWKLTQNFVSQVYLGVDIKDLLVANLQAAGLSEGTDYDLSRLTGDYPKREYVVQYEETDFDFISRWLEHEGICYFFEQTENGDRIVFGDDTTVYKDIAGNPQLAYRPPQSGRSEAEVRESDSAQDDWFAEEVVLGARWRQRSIPAEVKLKDYNWRNPQDPLQVSAAVKPDGGVGLWWEYNDHFKTDQEGQQLADVRAGEFLSGEKLLVGESDCRSLQPGATISLVDHFRAELNANWVLLEVRHHATQTVAMATSASVSATYSNSFVAMPADRVYRPDRTTEWPCIKGVIHAVIESTVDGKPDINPDGAYRVRLPFDVAGEDKQVGGASRYIRFAQPHAGRGYGTHFPLRAGAEVILAHIDGDPDRPIIAGAVPNRDNPSPVNQDNHEKNVIRSQSGNHIEFDDTPGSEGLTLYNGGGTGVMSFRTGGAGGGGGAGGLTPPASARNPFLPPLDDSPGAIGGGFTGGGASFSPRAGIFSGPLAQLSLDGSSLLPGVVMRDDDDVSGGYSDGTTTGGADQATAESNFFGHANVSGSADPTIVTSPVTEAMFTAGLNEVADPAGQNISFVVDDPDSSTDAHDTRVEELTDRLHTYPTLRQEATDLRADAERYDRYAANASDSDDRRDWEARARNARAEATAKDAEADAILTKYGVTDATVDDPPFPEASSVADTAGDATGLRGDAGAFFANTTRYGVTVGQDVLCVFGRFARYIQGDVVSHRTGTLKSITDTFTRASIVEEYGTSTAPGASDDESFEKKTTVKGHSATDVLVYGDKIDQLTVYGNIGPGETFVLGDYHVNNQTVFGDKDTGTITVYGDDVSGDYIIHGNTAGLNEVKGNRDGVTKTGGNDFSETHISGIQRGYTTVGTNAQLTFVGTSWGLELGGIYGSLAAGILKIDLAAAIQIAISLTYTFELALGGKFTFTNSGFVNHGPGHEASVKAAKTDIKAALTSIKVSDTGVVTASNTKISSLANTIASSRRWKQGIETLADALALVQQLRGVRYEWRDDGRPDVGFIAEEVGEVLPEVVEFEDDGEHAKGVCYAKLTAVLVEAMKQQQQQIDALSGEVARLRESLASAATV